MKLFAVSPRGSLKPEACRFGMLPMMPPERPETTPAEKQREKQFSIADLLAWTGLTASFLATYVQLVKMNTADTLEPPSDHPIDIIRHYAPLGFAAAVGAVSMIHLSFKPEPKPQAKPPVPLKEDESPKADTK